MNRPIRIASFGIFLIACMLSACNRQVAKAPRPETLVIFPPPPGYNQNSIPDPL